MPVNYQLGKIYKMESPSGLLYVGSTCEPTLARRLAGHKKHFYDWKNGIARFVTSYKLFEEDEENVNIILIENYPCNSKDELTAREAYWIKSTNCVNKVIPKRTPKEYYEDNKEKMIHNSKQYRENNKEKIQETQKEWRLKHPDYEKKYREEHAQQYQEKKERYRAKQKLIGSLDCVCGGKYKQEGKARHLGTTRHLSYLQSQNK